MLKITATSYNHSIIKFYAQSLNQILNNDIYKKIGLPHKIKKITLLRSPHVYKKSKVQYQQTKYSLTFYITNPDLSYVMSRFNTNILHGITLKFDYIQ